jgi:cell division protein FtsL
VGVLTEKQKQVSDFISVNKGWIVTFGTAVLLASATFTYTVKEDIAILKTQIQFLQESNKEIKLKLEKLLESKK